jgi:hypothetical protein
VTAIVYEVTRRETGDRYVGITGQTLSTRWAQHKNAAASERSTCHFHAAIRKYGPDAFDAAVVATLPTWHEAAIAERIAIAIERPRYNMNPGGAGCAEQSAESNAARRENRLADPTMPARMQVARVARWEKLGAREQWSARMSALHSDSAFAEKHRAATKAARSTEESRAKTSRQARAQLEKPGFREAMTQNLLKANAARKGKPGRKHTEATKQKMRLAHQARKGSVSL